MKTVCFHSEAEAEMIEAAVWYESQQVTLGKRFVTTVQKDEHRSKLIRTFLPHHGYLHNRYGSSVYRRHLSGHIVITVHSPLRYWVKGRPMYTTSIPIPESFSDTP